jgi:hypothetical protein
MFKKKKEHPGDALSLLANFKGDFKARPLQPVKTVI